MAATVETSSSSASPSSSTSSSQKSSSSSGTTSSSGNSNETTCSTHSTQDAVDGDFEEDQAPPANVWGRLLSLKQPYETQDLIKDSFSVGRLDGSDYQLKSKLFAPNIFLQFSNRHFLIYREFSKDKSYFTSYVKDLSSNGTFINDEKIGKNLVRVINDGDQIALSVKKEKAFFFQDLTSAESDKNTLPKEVQSKYILSKLLGTGACGQVRLAYRKADSKRFAMKIISKKTFSISSKLQSSTMDEVKILQEIDHPCMIKIEDVYDCSEALYIVLELVEGGELFDRILAVQRFPEPVAKLLFYQMLLGMKYLHDKGITHRDLKPENILLATKDNETLVKINDFGLSKFVGECSLMRTLCGTPNYLAPEVLKTHGTAGYDKMVDCWGLGCILYICLSGTPPFSDDYQHMTINQQILTGSYGFPKQIWSDISSEAIELVRKLLTCEPKDRYSVAEALNHPWLQDVKMKEKANALMAERPLTMQPPSDGPVAKKAKLQ